MLCVWRDGLDVKDCDVMRAGWDAASGGYTFQCQVSRCRFHLALTTLNVRTTQDLAGQGPHYSAVELLKSLVGRGLKPKGANISKP